MAMENKRIIQLSTERTTLGDDDYTIVDSDTNGTAKYRLSRLKETDTTLSVSGMAADAAATGQAINAETQARTQAVTAETQARQQAIEAESQARSAADTALGNDVNDLKSAMSDAETAIEQLEEQKADINGTYDDMTVGTAENVLSNKYALESVPYHFRKTGGDASVGSRLKEKIVGGTVAWNQLQKNTLSKTTNDVTFTYSNGALNVNGTASADTWWLYNSDSLRCNFYKDHVYLFRTGDEYVYSDGAKFLVSGTYFAAGGAITAKEQIKKCTTSGLDYMQFAVYTGTTVDNKTYYPQFFDLTAMFGSAIADHIYTLEQTTAGSGVALFRKLFNKEYYAYDAGSLQSVSGLVSHDEVGFNQWDEELELGSINNISGQNESTASLVRSKNYIRVLPGATYYFRNENKYVFNTYFYDSEKNYVSRGFAGDSTRLTFEVPSGCYYMRFRTNETTYGTVYKNDICINISDPSRNGEYEPYVKHSYPLDDSLTLRGLFKLDANNNIYADGDWYESEGKKTERYEYKSSGFSRGAKDSSGKLYAIASLTKSGLSDTSTSTCINNKLPSVGLTECRSNADNGTKSICVYETSVYAGGFVGSESELDNLLTNLELVYKLVTPTVTEAQPFINPQICDRYGTEEYVSTSIVPVGHETEYYEDVVAKVDGLPWDLSMIAPIDNGTTATRAYTTGQYFLHNDQFCKAKTNIASGATFTLNTNYEVTTVAAELYTALH